MGLLDKIKSFLGQGDAGQPAPGPETAGAESGTNVTVEREPTEPGADIETEAAVKGVDTAAESVPETDESGMESGDSSVEDTTPAESEEPEDERGSRTDAEAETVGGDTETTGESDPVDSIKGIGSAYADRLAGAGVETVADLLAADLGRVADEADISQSRLETWQQRARE